MRQFSKISFSFLVIMILFLGFIGGNIYAASDGDKLTSPEQGWVRYDDKDPLITYSGRWGTEVYAGSYKGSQRYSTAGTGTYSFVFTGTSFRLIGSSYSSHDSNAVEVTIDGVAEKYSGVKKIENRQVILFEKLNLPYGEHTVAVKNLLTTKNITIDAIDLKTKNTSHPINVEASPADSQVDLKWNSVQGAESYTVYYGTESGKYTEKVATTKDVYGNFSIPGLTNGTTYYFVVTATINGVESDYSKEASATPSRKEQPTPEPGEPTTPEQPSGDRAILVVTMTTGLEKEFDLSMKEVNDFISWYEAKQAGSGKASYAIDKHNNNKGPFSSRKDYILYDRVLTFEVSEY